ncbi:hypothetical protein ACWEOE_25080 [Amycolatopsis sp. NPDC004368]
MDVEENVAEGRTAERSSDADKFLTGSSRGSASLSRCRKER